MNLEVVHPDLFSSQRSLLVKPHRDKGESSDPPCGGLAHMDLLVPNV